MLSFVWLCKSYSQTWVSVIDSMPNSHPFVTVCEKDTINNILYLGGDFQQINNINTKGIIKYNGIKFDSLGAGLDPQWKGMFTPSKPVAMKMFQNKLYVGGQFTKAGKYHSDNIARWNGTDWDTLNFRMKAGNGSGTVEYLDSYNNELYVAGGFDSIGGIKTNNFAKFDGTNWHSLSYPYYTCVSGMANYKGKLYMSGEVSPGSSCSNIAFYDGVSWHPWTGIYGNVNKGVFGLKVIDSLLFVYGRFYSVGGTNCSGLAAWNGTKWLGFGKGVETVGTIHNIAKVNGELYIMGVFDSINELSTGQGVFNYYTNIAKFDFVNQKWCTFMPPMGNGVEFATEYNNELYFGGAYLTINDSSTPAMPFTKWIGGNTSVNCGAFVDVSVKEYNEPLHFSIYPNPTTSIINLVDENNQLQNSTIEIQNYLGVLVYSSSFTSQINLSSLSSGMYFLIIKDKAIRKTIKIIRE